jgi:hypothetical protein
VSEQPERLFTVAHFYDLACRDVDEALRILFEELNRPGTRESRESAMHTAIDVLREADAHLGQHGAVAMFTSLADKVARADALAKEALKPEAEG